MHTKCCANVRGGDKIPFPSRGILTACGRCVVGFSLGRYQSICGLPCSCRSCPECRVISEFVIPSVYWVEEQEKKNELIEAFKQGVG